MLYQKISFLEPQGFQRINKNKFCKMKCVIVYLWNKTKEKNMTNYQKTLTAYANGQKSMAFLSFKNDPTSNKNLTFNQFCIAFDKLMIEHKSNRPINPISKKQELPIWEA